MSDFPFLCFAYAALVLILRAEGASDARPRQTWAALAVGLALALAYGTRSIGLILLPAMALADLIRFRRLTRLTRLAAIPLAGYAILQSLFLHSDQDYLVQFGNTPQTVVSHFTYYTKELRDLWRNSYSGVVMRILFLTVNGLGIFGYVSMLRRGPTVREIFPILYVATILSWPHYQGIRFLFPLIPLYIFYALVGLQRLPVPQRPVSSRRLALRVLVGAIVVSYAARYTTRNFGPLEEGVGRPESVALFDYVKRHTEEDAVVVFAKPRVLSLYTGRRAAVYHTNDDESLLRYLRTIEADYAITAPVFFWDTNFFGPFLERQREHFEEVYANPMCTMYRFSP